MSDCVSLVNGERCTGVAVSDRGLAYGDGLFETLAIRQGRPCQWLAHLDRLARGAVRLGIPPPSPQRLRQEAKRLLEGIEQGTLKMILTRGCAGRGYAPPRKPEPTRILIAYSDDQPLPSSQDQWPNHAAPARVRVCETRLSANPRLAGLKHLNRLEQVLARSEWSDPAIDEGLMLDDLDQPICGTRTNLFLWQGSELRTPFVDRCGVAGIGRETLLAVAGRNNIAVRVERIRLQDLACAQAAFLTNALVGVWPVASIDGRVLDWEGVPLQPLAAAQAAILNPESDW